MSTEIAVLRALLRLSRLPRREAPQTLQDLLPHVGQGAPEPTTLLELQRALASLAGSQLVQRDGETARLSLAGLAVAAAADASARAAGASARKTSPRAARERAVVVAASASAPTARIFPLRMRVRRHRAA